MKDQIAHDLNNLLAKILGAAEIAALKTDQMIVRQELELIADLAENAASLVTTLASCATAEPG